MSLVVTGTDLCTRALRTVQVYQGGETPSATDLNDAFVLLNELVDSWAIESLTIPTVQRYVFALDGVSGGPDAPYTLGPGATWDTTPAERPPQLQEANLLLNTNSPYVRIPLAIITTDMTAGATPIPNLLNTLPVTLYYTPTVPNGKVILWPIPTQTVNQIELWAPLVMPQFATLSTGYICPPAYAKAFRLNLAAALVPYFGVPPSVYGTLLVDAADELSKIKADNAQMADLSLDPAWAPQPHGTYVIQSDTGA